jgi:hypothetical protein
MAVAEIDEELLLPAELLVGPLYFLDFVVERHTMETKMYDYLM